LKIPLVNKVHAWRTSLPPGGKLLLLKTLSHGTNTIFSCVCKPLDCFVFLNPNRQFCVEFCDENIISNRNDAPRFAAHQLSCRRRRRPRGDAEKDASTKASRRTLASSCSSLGEAGQGSILRNPISDEKISQFFFKS
jgi:hypothetical protein